MNDNTPDSIRRFNRLYSDDSLNKLKIISAHFTEYPLNFIAVYIRLLELQYTLRAIQSCSCKTSHGILSALNMDTIQDICKEIQPFCNSAEQNSINTLLNLWQNMSNMQEMMQMMEFMQEMNGTGDSDGNGSGGMGMGMDPSDLINLFSAFSNPT